MENGSDELAQAFQILLNQAMLIERGEAILPLYIWSLDEQDPWSPGTASRWWLHHSLKELEHSLQTQGLQLILRQGASTLQILREVVKETGALGVYWNRQYEPYSQERDQKIENSLTQQGLEVQTFNSTLLFEPWEINNKEGKPYRVFTAFWRACLAKWPPPDESITSEQKLISPALWPKSESLESLQLLPRLNWADGFHTDWTPGESAALRRFERFLDEPITQYQEGRDRPDQDGVSRLSPHLHFGEISPRLIYWSVREKYSCVDGSGPEVFLRELGYPG
jgi:deoxyribodipyrimidine photo-lyase